MHHWTPKKRNGAIDAVERVSHAQLCLNTFLKTLTIVSGKMQVVPANSITPSRLPLVALFKISGRTRTGSRYGSGRARQKIHLHPREGVSVGKLGCATGNGWKDRLQGSYDRRGPSLTSSIRNSFHTCMASRPRRPVQILLNIRSATFLGRSKIAFESGYTLREVIDSH